MKPYVICHMMASIDGRIDCDMTEKIETDDVYYDALDSLGCDSTIEGRVTVAKHYALKEHFSGDRTPVGEDCHYVSYSKSTIKKWQIFVDTKGMLMYPEDFEENRLIILSQQAPKAYLEYLRSKEISYVVSGEKEIDFPKALEVLNEKFNVKRLALVGGGHLNGAFLKAGLIDEISVMIAPGIDGREGQPSVFDGLAENEPQQRLRLTWMKQYPMGTIWMKYSLA